MARSIKDIHNELIAAKQAEPLLNDINSSSMVALWRLWLYVVAVAIFAHENLIDEHKEETDEKLRKQKVHTLTWIEEKARAFQLGHSLQPNEDYYDNTGLTQQQIETAQIVKYASATWFLLERDKRGRTEDGGIRGDHRLGKAIAVLQRSVGEFRKLLHVCFRDRAAVGAL